ncbi:magnesium and cobalt transport protein and translocase of inner mitochondrial membrane [Aspergillus avenaceus]|uniref:Magnesium and cobalt transport protein and translocase of inner mitochondrial membrane n=1 Tax=Aspergillus avenaceus TaxID=36643 RepID=A0A5N6TME1_ASPAV|nr:magnesium and cobalt transport protein and translocase of inner mitochondrial membrane [Aspergillus avenaceus]
MYSDEIPRFNYFSSQSEKDIVTSDWGEIFCGQFIDQIQESNKKTEGNVWWLDICDATEQDVDVVAEALSIHPLTAEDIVTREPREKVEVFRGYYLITFQTLVTFTDDGDDRRSIASKSIASSMPSSAGCYILVFRNGAVTFSPSGCSHINRVRDRIRRLPDPSVLTSDWICYALMDDVVDSFEPYLQAVEGESEAIEDQVFIARLDDVQSLIPRIDNLRKKITHLIRVLSGKVDLLNGFVKRCQAKDKQPVFPGGELLMYLGDVQDHLVTTMSNLMHFDGIVGRSQSNCLAQLSANNLRLSLNINEVLSKVTVLATIFVPLHMITGLFGMNVTVPGQDIPGLAWFFGIVGCFISFIIVCCYAAWRYKLL